MARRGRVANVVAGIGDAGIANLRTAGRDHRSRLQRRQIAFSFVRQLRSFTLVCLSSALVIPILRAESTRASQGKIWEEFSGDRALAHVQRLVDLGPRPPGSEAIEKSRDYIENQLRLFGWQVTRQAFTHDTPRGKIRFVNLIARFRAQGSTAPSFLLCSHYDTKTFDTIRFVGANDAGSSTGLLLELARVLGQHPNLAAKVELVFFDGEEAYENFSETDGLYGSRYFARQLADAKTGKQFRGGILFDMACGNGARYFCVGRCTEIAKLFQLLRPRNDRRPHAPERDRNSDNRRD